MTTNIGMLVNNECYYHNRICVEVKKLFPAVDEELVRKTLSYMEDNGEYFRENVKHAENKNLPFAVTKLEASNYLIHLGKMNGEANFKPKKGSFKVCFPIIEVNGDKVKKRAELVISKMKEFETRFPNFRREFYSKHIIHAPLHEIESGRDCKSLIYPFYEYTLYSFLQEHELADSEKLDLLLNFALGVKEIHDQNFVHRDLKEVNSVVKFDKLGQIKIKVADLDSVIEEDKTTIDDYFGTLFYVPYERPVCKTDVYSLGRILAKMFKLEPVAYVKDTLPDHVLSAFEQNVLELILLTKVDSDRRISSKEFVERLAKIKTDLDQELSSEEFVASQIEAIALRKSN